jgi:C1A family cysteine protease
MKFVAALLATAVSADSIVQKFMRYAMEHRKSYLTKSEFEARMNIFANTEAYIAQINSTQSSYTVGHNFFSDLSDSERAQYHGAVVDTKKMMAAEYVELSTEGLPSSVDWRTEGGVNAVQNQGSCGSCWAFSTVQSMETAHWVSTGNLLKFSEQQLVDCNADGYSCNGGWWAWDYYQTADAVLQSDYAYAGVDQSCMASQYSGTGVRDLSSANITPGSESQMKAALAQQAISVAVDVTLGFQLYTTGIYNPASCGTAVNHGVGLVGYGSDNGQDYYILRNSWGASWGESGYMRIADNGVGAGVCAVQLHGSYPTTN